MKIIKVTAAVSVAMFFFTSMGFAAKGRVQVTIYNDNMALVNEQRLIPLKKGLNKIRFPDVPARIDPSSVQVTSLTDPGGTRVLEQRFEYDLVSTSRLLEKYLGRRIKVVTRDGTTHKGTLMGTGGGIIIRNASGEITVLEKEYLREITLPALRNGLVTRPTLIWLIDAAGSGKHKIELAYITEGINWHADYVLSLSGNETKADLDGWITLDNRTGMTFRDVHANVVAGSLHRALPSPGRVSYHVLRKEAGATKKPQVQQRNLFEYPVYDIKRSLTIRNNQTMQIQFVTRHQIPVKKRFVLDSGRSYSWFPDHRHKGNAEIQLLVTNDLKSGLGIPLPAGVCRIYKSDVDESKQLIGEDRILHTPIGENITLTAGKAFDVVGERVKTSQKILGKRSRKETWRIEVWNHKRKRVTVHIVERLNRFGARTEWKIVSESQHHTNKTANAVDYLAKVPARGKAEITYTVVYRR